MILLASIFLAMVAAVAPAPQPARPADAPRQYSALVLSVHDGDTIAASVNLGLDVSKKETIRLDGIDAPELPTPEGERARAYLGNLLLYKDVVIVSHGREKYGRLLAVIWLGSTNVNELLISKGYAKSYNGGRREP